MTARRIAILGGGPFVGKLIDALLARDDLACLDIRLVARNLSRLEIIANHCRARLNDLRPNWRLRAEPLLPAALDGAEVVILMIRAGGLSARMVDETFPRSYNLAGDEGLGPGGMANALRTTPVLAPIIDLISEFAPNALIANLVAPLGITTHQLCEGGLSAVGLCELPKTTERQLLNALPPDLQSASLAYGGFNHLGWFWPIDDDGFRALDQIAAAGLTDRDVIERFRALPLSYYFKIFDQRGAARLGLWQEYGRAEFLAKLVDRAVAEMALRPGAEPASLQERETPWFEFAVAPFVAAALGGRPYIGFLNVTNLMGFSGLPREIVVELRASYCAGAMDIGAPYTPPSPVKQFLKGIGEAEDWMYKACMGQGRPAVLAALDALPISVPAITREALADDIFAASKKGDFG